MPHFIFIWEGLQNTEKKYNSIKSSDTGCQPVGYEFIEFVRLEYRRNFAHHFFNKILTNEGWPIALWCTNVLLRLLLQQLLRWWKPHNGISSDRNADLWQRDYVFRITACLSERDHRENVVYLFAVIFQDVKTQGGNDVPTIICCWHRCQKNFRTLLLPLTHSWKHKRRILVYSKFKFYRSLSSLLVEALSCSKTSGTSFFCWKAQLCLVD